MLRFMGSQRVGHDLVTELTEMGVILHSWGGGLLTHTHTHTHKYTHCTGLFTVIYLEDTREIIFIALSM